MQGTPNPGCRRAGPAAAVAVVILFTAASMRADDLQTLSGQTFHAVRPVRVEPDGVTWEHAGGVVKVDFSDSPAPVREAYHYDAAKAAAYQSARAEAQRQSVEQARQVLQASTEHQRTRAQAMAAAASASAEPLPGSPPTLVYRHGLSDAAQAAARSLGEQVDARKAQAAADARNGEGLLGDPRLWRFVPGVGSKPKPLLTDRPDTAEYKASLHHSAGDAFAAGSTADTFFNPLYMTRSYNEDLDRAAAFAHDTPLK